MKPHIRPLKNSGAKYECKLPKGISVGYGNTPEEAFENWRNAAIAWVSRHAPHAARLRNKVAE